MTVDLEGIKKVRELTAASIVDCKSAIEEAKNDIEKAMEILRKKGLAKAEKKMERPTCEGCIGSYVHSNGKVGAIVELTCETDFVARNSEFLDLLHDICLQVVGAQPIVLSKEDLSKEIIEKERTFYAEDIKGKPPEIAEKIIEGKLEKFLYSQKCLLHQNFINEAKFKGTVSDMIKSKIAKLGENITVRRFVRFEVGG